MEIAVGPGGAVRRLVRARALNYVLPTEVTAEGPGANGGAGPGSAGFY